MRLIWVLTIIILFFLSGVTNGITDHISFHYDAKTSKLQPESFWNPKKSWINKYKLDDEGNVIEPKRERFFGSTTFLSWTTDAWHLFKGIMFLLLFVATMIGIAAKELVLKWWGYVVAFGILYIAKAAGFHLMYTLILPNL